MTVKLKHWSGVEVTPENNRVRDDEYMNLPEVLEFLEANRSALEEAAKRVNKAWCEAVRLLGPPIQENMALRCNVYGAIFPPMGLSQKWHGLIYQETGKGPVEASPKFRISVGIAGDIEIWEDHHDEHTF